MDEPWLVEYDTTQKAMMKDAKNVVPKKSDSEDQGLDANKNFD